MKNLNAFLRRPRQIKQREMVKSKVLRRTGTRNADSTNYLPT